MTDSEVGIASYDRRQVELRRRRLVATTHTVLGLLSATVIAIAWIRSLHPMRQPFHSLSRYGAGGALLIGVWPYLGSWLHLFKSVRFSESHIFLYLAGFLVVSLAASALGVYLLSEGFGLWAAAPVTLMEYLAFRAIGYGLLAT